MNDDIVLEEDLAASPQTVWRAIAEPELAALWLGANDMAAETGSAFTVSGAPGGEAACEVIESRPPHHLAVTWREGGAESRVDFDLTEIPHGTRLRVIHGGVKRPAGSDVTAMKRAA